MEGYGISMRSDYKIDAAIITWAWPDYLDPTMYRDGGIAGINGKQRLSKVTGKNASNYGEGPVDGQEMRNLGNNELIYLAPYLINKDGFMYWADPGNVKLKMRDGVLADGPGEEVFAITKDGKKLIYPPMRVNR